MQTGREVRRVEKESKKMSKMSIRGLSQGRDGPGPGSDRGSEKGQIQENAGEEVR